MKELSNLMPETEKLLRKLAKSELLKQYTFVGGSALSVYLKHRFSEDIDLFSWEQNIDVEQIQQQIQEIDTKTIRTVNLSPRQADFIIDGVKVTFFANHWNELQNRSQIVDNLHIAKLETIAVMKVNTLFLRAKFRDYYDLYILNLEYFTLPEIYEMANMKIKNLTITLFQRAIIFINDIEDENIKHLKPKYKVDLRKIQTHFSSEIKKWNKTLKTKQ